MTIFRILLILILVVLANAIYSQIKVIEGNVVVGPNPSGTPDKAGLKAYGETELELALDAGAGAPDFSLQLSNQTKAAFRYNSSLSGGGLEILCDNASTTDAGMPGSARKIFIHGTTGNVGIGENAPGEKLHVNGSINYTGSLNNVSDIRLKKNISPFEYGLSEILALKPINFEYNGKAGITTKGKHIGLLAQEVQEIAPSLTSTWIDLEYDKETLEDIQMEKTPKIIKEEAYLKVNEGAIKYMIINAIQEQQTLITQRDQEIETLKQQLLRQERQMAKMQAQLDVLLKKQ